MANHNHSRQVRIASGINALLGLWLIFTPMVYPFMAGNVQSVWNSVITGALIAIFGFSRLGWPRENAELSWTNVALGAWMALSPWIFDYMEGGSLWNSLLVGLTVIMLAIWSGSATVADRQRVRA